ncbi:MAG: peptide chain release factor N(5)-glutamine methyltransferase [Chloroflexota bacterium]
MSRSSCSPDSLSSVSHDLPSDASHALPTDADAGSALSWALGLLAGAEVDTPRLDAELLLCHALGWTRASLYAHPERLLSKEESERLRRLIGRRVQREPLAYLTKRKEFYGLEFLVDRRVLIPRPETELLVELAVARLRAMLRAMLPAMLRTDPAPIVADVGTGCGAIAVSVAIQIPTAKVYALDVSPEALEVARVNCQRHGMMRHGMTRHGVAGRVELLRGDLLEPLGERVDLVLANLPYIARSEFATLQPEIVEYEPRVALDGGQDGMDGIRCLLEQASEHLAPGASIMLEIGSDQGAVGRVLADRFFPNARIEVHPDYAGHDRVLEIDTAVSTGG